MSTSEPTAPGTHCEFCGAEYEGASKQTAKTTPLTRSPSEKEGPVDEPVAHCEFCGAEYEAPGGQEG